MQKEVVSQPAMPVRCLVASLLSDFDLADIVSLLRFRWKKLTFENGLARAIGKGTQLPAIFWRQDVLGVRARHSLRALFRGSDRSSLQEIAGATWPDDQARFHCV